MRNRVVEKRIVLPRLVEAAQRAQLEPIPAASLVPSEQPGDRQAQDSAADMRGAP